MLVKGIRASTFPDNNRYLFNVFIDTGTNFACHTWEVICFVFTFVLVPDRFKVRLVFKLDVDVDESESEVCKCRQVGV